MFLEWVQRKCVPEKRADIVELVSIIVPIYKVEPYLEACIASIVNQTYRNLEIILVDDGSPDRCPEMCDAWAEKDSRIRVIHKENRAETVRIPTLKPRMALPDETGFCACGSTSSTRKSSRATDTNCVSKSKRQ